MKAAADAEGSATVGVENLKADLKTAFPFSEIIEIYPGVPGDTNGDNVIDIYDLLFFAQSWQTAPGNSTSDVNQDNAVNSLDLIKLIELWSENGG